ncbi:MAG: GNAT family N-acetyltransferase [candidate division Zixibacteria bacterium]|nr:GNAT family N-acetyltransferase [candidate division Zixibacteria bacterium]
MVFQTPRLVIRKAVPSDHDVELYYALWSNPKVMTFVGFPEGLKMTREDIRNQLAGCNETEYDRLLIVELKDTNQPIGECKLGLPNSDDIAGTDVKLLPEFWRNGYGSEVKRGLVEYLLAHTDCKAIKATPNKLNIASQKMQESVGGKCVGEDTYHFPEKMRSYTVDLDLYIYHVSRTDYERNK